MPRLSIKELRNICQPNRGRSWTESISRKYSIYLTWVFIRLPISANQITSLSIILSFISMLIIIASNDFFLWVVALSIYLFSLSLDYVDGEVARYHKKSSLTGLLFDRLAGSFGPFFLFLGIMYRSFLLTGSLLSITLGILAVMSVFVPRLAMSAMYQTSVEALIKTTNISGTVSLTSTTEFITLDKLAEKGGIVKQIGWFLLGHGLVWFLFGCFYLEFLVQSGMLLQLNLFIVTIPVFPGFFMSGFLFYYGVFWLAAGIGFSYNILRRNQTEGLYGYLLAFYERNDEEEDPSAQSDDP